MSSFSEEEIEEFKVEALELLDGAEKSLLSLDDGGDFRTCFDTTFRGLHNLKGAAGMMELDRLQAHTHELESIFMKFKSADSIPKHYISFFLRGIDAAKVILDGDEVQFNYNPEESVEARPVAAAAAVEEVQSAHAEEAENSSEVISVNDEFLEECEEIIDRVSECLQFIENDEPSKDIVDAIYRDVHSLKGAAYLFSCNMIGDIGHAMESSLEKVRNGTHGMSPKLLNGLFKSLEVLESIVNKMKVKASIDDFAPIVPVLARALTSASEQLPKIEVKDVDEVKAVEEKLEVMAKVVELPKVQKKVSPEAPAHIQHEKGDSEGGTGSIRVPVSLLDNLMTLMGEMVLVRNQVLQFSNQFENLELQGMSKRLNVVTSEIQEEMMKTRMQPIGNVLSKFNRVVRDLSHDLNKKINIVLSGTETELDKTLLEAIKDPLTHIIRNACDHGIETPDERVHSGKAETGTINVKSYHEGGQVIIEIIDDGKGLNKEKLIAKAIEKNIITQTKAATLTDKQVFELIFAPGFSTAAAVTNVSGRGVGMDVVRTNIEKIGGTVDISSALGLGTSIKLKIPLTLAIIPALLVKCGNENFAIPQVKLEELVRVDQQTSEVKVESLHGSPVYRLRGKILPLVDLRKLLHLSEEKINYATGTFNIVVLNSDGVPFGVIVDEVLDTADIVVKPINRLLKSLQVYSGATILGDGSIALIFDVLGVSKVAQILSKAENTTSQETKIKHSEFQDFLLVGLDSSVKHAITLNYVHRLEEFRQKDIEYSGMQPVIRYRDALLPIIDVNKSLGFNSTLSQLEKISVVVVEKAGAFYGLAVNEILDTLSTELQVKPTVKEHPGIFGNLSTESELIVVVDPFEIISNEGFVKDEVVEKDQKSGTVLLVEDTIFFQRAIRDVLEKRGYKVICANNGREALSILEKGEHNFNIIVSDIEMPHLNGFEMARAIRSDSRWKTIPLIAVSSKADRDHIKKGMSVGFDMYLEKLKPQVLCAAISELTSHRAEKRVS